MLGDLAGGDAVCVFPTHDRHHVVKTVKYDNQLTSYFLHLFGDIAGQFHFRAKNFHNVSCNISMNIICRGRHCTFQVPRLSHLHSHECVELTWCIGRCLECAVADCKSVCCSACRQFSFVTE